MVDMTANRSDTYADVVHHACEVLKLQDRPGRVMCIFKLNGSLVPDAEGWTLDQYLRKCHTSAEKTRIGIGSVPIEVVM